MQCKTIISHHLKEKQRIFFSKYFTNPIFGPLGNYCLLPLGKKSKKLMVRSKKSYELQSGRGTGNKEFTKLPLPIINYNKLQGFYINT